MKRFTLISAVALTALMALGSACTAPKPAPKPPATISGTGYYDFAVQDSGVDVFTGGNEADILLTRDAAGVYTGVVQSVNCADPGLCPGNNAELTVVGKAATELYVNDVNLGPGVGPEMTTTNVTVTSLPSSPICPGAGIEIYFEGDYTVDGAPSNLTGQVTWTVCDPTAATWFA